MSKYDKNNFLDLIKKNKQSGFEWYNKYFLFFNCISTSKYTVAYWYIK